MDSPVNLLGRPATRYRGTDIDGATLAPEGLWVRGKNLNALIGALTFEEALWHVWFDRVPEPHESAAVRTRLARHGEAFARGNASIEAAARLGEAGVEMVFAAAGGLMRDVDRPPMDEPRDAHIGTAVAWDEEFDALLACLAGAPHLMRAALGWAGAVDGPPRSHARRVLNAARRGQESAPDALAERVMDALLVAWHAGFGYITPTVLVPRCAIGTGVTLAQAIAAGFMSSGPKHVGAAREAMRWLKETARTIDRMQQAERHANGADVNAEANAEAEATAESATSANAEADANAIHRAVDRALDERGVVLSGFGHPLFEEDPRPPHLRASFAAWGFNGRFMRHYDAACAQAARRKGLKPNIDFITAAALLDLGIDEPCWGVGVGLCARMAAMGAHALERRSRPAFGVNSATARKLLAAVPVGWL
jgi:citrate synthase